MTSTARPTSTPRRSDALSMPIHRVELYDHAVPSFAKPVRAQPSRARDPTVWNEPNTTMRSPARRHAVRRASQRLRDRHRRRASRFRQRAARRSELASASPRSPAVAARSRSTTGASPQHGGHVLVGQHAADRDRATAHADAPQAARQARAPQSALCATSNTHSRPAHQHALETTGKRERVFETALDRGARHRQTSGNCDSAASTVAALSI